MYAIVGCRFVVGAVFVLAAVAKLPRRAEFEAAVRGYGLVPSRAVVPIARLLPAAELAGGLLLLAGLGSRLVAAILAAALAVFSAAVAATLARGRTIDCGCFAVGASPRVTWLTVGRNLLLSAMAVLVATQTATPFALDSAIGDGRGPLPFRDGLAAALTATILVFAAGLAGEAQRLRRAIGAGRAAQAVSAA